MDIKYLVPEKYNEFPPNWHELSAEEFAKSTFFGWHPISFEHRQMIPRTPEMDKLMAYKDGRLGTVVSATLWWMPSGEGFAIVNDFWGGTVRYFGFGERHADWLKGVDSSD